MTSILLKNDFFPQYCNLENLQNSYTLRLQVNTLSLRCNICSIEIDEKEVESHIITKQHIENKSKISTNGKGLGKSVSSMWHKSLE